MKKLILLIVLLLGSTMSLFAQNYQEVVYLKSGSIIRGVIIEQIPNVSLKIQTPDNSLFVCQMSEVEKITKEIQENKHSRARYQATKNNSNVVRGYKGFIETGYSSGTGDQETNCFELSTSHGYQFNRYIFLGAGLGLNYYEDSENRTVPIFVDFRSNFTRRKVSPVGEVRLGYANGDIKGGYFSTSMGVRFAVGVKTALSVKLSYTYQENDDYTYVSGFNLVRTGLDRYLQSLGVRVGFEF